MNLDCTELITEYLKQSNTDQGKSHGYGYERGWIIEKILGATDIYGELMFL